LQAQDIFAPDQTSLVDGIVRVNGCTGSFVSSQGLILTNHHCAYRAIQSSSTADRDLLADGFIAWTGAEEIPALGYTVRITRSYQDVSEQVLSVLQPEMDFVARTKAIERQSRLLEQAAEQANPGLRAEVAEMFIGKTYGLFLYIYLRDVRLVFAPPASIGNFGGEVDNWQWPRHTGDFAFMRAYTAPDGSAADYAPENVPYQPKRFLQVKPEGVAEGDTVMLLGYPGRTARHHTSAYLRLLRDVTLPGTIQSYQWQMAVMEAAGRDRRDVAIKHANRIKSLANVEKRSRGQLQGLRRTTILADREEEEAKLQAFIEADPARQAKYGTILADIAAVYQEQAETAPCEMLERNFVEACRTLYLAFQVYDAAREREKPDVERESPYMERNMAQTIQQWRLAQRDLDPATDRQILSGLVEQWAELEAVNGGQSPASVAGQASGVELAFAEERAADGWADPAFLDRLLTLSADDLAAHPDAALQWVVAMYPRLIEIRLLEKQRQGRLNRLYGELMTVKQQFLATQFVPDANATLRLTSGRVKGFSPADAVQMSPFTTLAGLAQKTTQVEPFETPERVLELIAQRQYGAYAAAALGQVPVNLLYDTDTTGGNSGSPIMDGSGRLVGVNFDRAFEATINDFAWNPDYSRSIGVDIRYVLWVTGMVYQAQHLIAEMGVQTDRTAYWIFLTSGQPSSEFSREEIEVMQARHLANFRRLHSLDRLAAAGPLGDPQRQLRGMVYATAENLDQLKQFFEPDPFVANRLLQVEALPIADQIGNFNAAFSIGAMESFDCVVFQWVDEDQAIGGSQAARDSWQQLQDWYRPDLLRLAARFTAAPPPVKYAGVAVFKQQDRAELEARLQQLPVVREGQIRFTVMPLYMSQGILD
jgi:uncharacterized protein YciI